MKRQERTTSVEKNDANPAENGSILAELIIAASLSAVVLGSLLISIRMGIDTAMRIRERSEAVSESYKLFSLLEAFLQDAAPDVGIEAVRLESSTSLVIQRLSPVINFRVIKSFGSNTYACLNNAEVHRESHAIRSTRHWLGIFPSGVRLFEGSARYRARTGCAQLRLRAVSPRSVGTSIPKPADAGEPLNLLPIIDSIHLFLGPDKKIRIESFRTGQEQPLLGKVEHLLFDLSSSGELSVTVGAGEHKFQRIYLIGSEKTDGFRNYIS